MNFITPITLGFILVLGNVHATFDHTHSDWAAVLLKRVSIVRKQTLVDYRGLKAAPQQLNTYLRKLSSVTKVEYNQFSKDQKLAFLINSYNSFTVKLIIDHYPLKSIKDIGSFFSGPWDKEFISLLGTKVDLDHIEHTLIRKNFDEPRIHFAVNCASISCPNLSLKPFRAEDLNEHLELMAVAFFSDSDKNNFQSRKARLNLSKIFKWYGDDFDKHYPGGLNAFLAKHLAASEGQKQLIQQGRASKKFLTYDWSLNKAH